MTIVLLLAVLLAPQGELGPGASSLQGIALELMDRFATADSALAIAANSQTRRVYLADGASIREFVVLSPGMLTPSAGSPVDVPARPAGLCPLGNQICVATDHGVHLVDPMQQRVVRSRTGFRALGLDVDSGLIYAAVFDDARNACGLYVLDQNLAQLGALTGYCEAPCCDQFSVAVADVSVSSAHAYIVGMQYGGFAGVEQGFLATVDVSDPLHLTGLTDHACLLPGIPLAIDVVGQYAFIAGQLMDQQPVGSGGTLVVVDISDPAMPQPLGRVDTPSPLTDVVAVPPYALATDEQGHVLAFAVHEPTAPVVAAYVATGFPANGLWVEEAHVYVANGRGGMAVLGIVPVLDPTPTPGLVLAEGTVSRVQACICQAGETHVLVETNTFLFSDWLDLDGCVDQRVRAWGWPVDSPECYVLHVRVVQLSPGPAHTPTLLPAVPEMRLYLPMLRRPKGL